MRVAHQVIVSGACQWWWPSGVVDVAGAEVDGRFAACLDLSASFGDVERLAADVGVPGGARPWRVVHCADGELRVAVGLDDGVKSTRLR